MKLTDLHDDRTYSLPDVHRMWAEFKKSDPVNHCDSFLCEFFEILMATVNGRNDLDIVGLTPSETSNYILALRDKIEGRTSA